MDKDRLTRRLSEVQRSRKIMESRVQERTAALIAANEALQAEIVAHRRAEEEIHLLLAITRALTEAQDFHSALKMALRQICENTGWDYGESWVPTANREVLRFGAAWHRENENLDRFRSSSESFTFSPGIGLPGRVWASKKPEWVQDVSILPENAFPRVGMAMTAGLRATLGIPIIADNQVLAVLMFCMFERREEDERLVEIVSAVATHLGTVLQRKRTEQELRKAHEELERRVQERTVELAKANEALNAEIVERKRIEGELAARHRELLTLQRISEITLNANSLETAFQAIVQEISTATGFPAVVIELYDEARQKMVFRGIKGISLPPGERGLEVPVDETLSGIVARSGEPLVETNAWERTEYAHRILREQGCRTFVCVPMKNSKGVIGVLSLASSEVIRVDDGFLQLATELANHVASLIERKRAEDWLRTLIDANQDAVISINRGGRIVLFNPSAERLFGYKREEVTGEPVTMLMPEPYASEHDEYVARYERTGEARAIGRIRTVTGKRKNGEAFPIELSVTEIAADEEVHYAAFIRDISEKTRLQEQLVEKERLAAIGATAAKIGHELANPLNSISLAVQLLEQRLKKLTDVEETQVVPTVTKIRDEISRLNTLLLDFRAFARRETYRFRPTNISELIDDCIELERLRLAESKTELEKDVPRDLPEIAVDRDRIKQVLLNLCKNAVEAMPGGGKIIVKASASDDKITLEVTDTGIGIPAGRDIFEPFFTTKREGTGLGLTIVRQMIAAHGGTISYHSQPGKGTTFRIALPRNVNSAEA